MFNCYASLLVQAIAKNCLLQRLIYLFHVYEGLPLGTEEICA